MTAANEQLSAYQKFRDTVRRELLQPDSSSASRVEELQAIDIAFRAEMSEGSVLAPLSDSVRVTNEARATIALLQPVLAKDCIASVYSGSMAFGEYYAVRNTTDIDLLVVVESWHQAVSVLQTILDVGLFVGENIEALLEFMAGQIYFDTARAALYQKKAKGELGNEIAINFVTETCLNSLCDEESMHQGHRDMKFLRSDDPYGKKCSSGMPVYDTTGTVVESCFHPAEVHEPLSVQQRQVGWIENGLYRYGNLAFYVLIHKVLHDDKRVISKARKKLVEVVSKHAPKNSSDFGIVRQERMPSSYFKELIAEIYQT